MSTPRVRSQNGFVKKYGTESTTLCNNTVNNSTPSFGEIIGDGIYRYMEDIIDHDFKSRSEKGVIFNNRLYSKRIVSAVASLGTGNWSLKSQYLPCSGSVVKSGTHTGTFGLSWNSVPVLTYSPSVDIATAEALAGTAALANIAEPEVQGFVDIIELRKTLRMLKNPIAKLDRLVNIAERRFKKVKARNSTDARNLADFISSNWLQYRYGFVPLMLSVNGIMKALSNGRTSKRFTARGSAFVPIQNGSSTAVYNAPANGGFKRTVNITGSNSYNVRAGILYEYNTSFANDLGLTLTEIPSTAWELIPYSFVADWFVNAGDYIRAVTPKTGVKILSSWTSVKLVNHINISVVGQGVTTPSGSYTYTGAPGMEFSRSETTVTRSPGVKCELVPKVQEIDFSRTKDILHAADALALIGQKLLGKSHTSGKRRTISINYVEL